MSMHIEWARASQRPEFIDEEEAADFTDSHGQGIDAGNVALFIGDGIVLEGTRKQIAKWLQAGLRLVGAQPVYAVDREYVDELAGRPVTDDEAYRVGEAIPNSSIPDALREVIFACTHEEPTTTVYVIDEEGATFALVDQQLAEDWYQSESAGGAVRLVMFTAQAPTRLASDLSALAEWCCGNAEPIRFIHGDLATYRDEAGPA